MLMTCQVRPFPIPASLEAERLDYARQILRGEAAALELVADRSTTRFSRPSISCTAAGPRLRHRHRQVGRRRPEDRRHAELDGHPRLRPRRHPGRPRRPRHGPSRRRRPRPLAQRRERGDRPAAGAAAAAGPGHRRPHRQRAAARWPARPTSPSLRPARRGLPAGPGAQHQHDGDDRRRRRPGLRPEPAARFHAGRLRPLPPGRQPRPQAPQGRGGHAPRRRPAPRRRRRRPCAKCSPRLARRGRRTGAVMLVDDAGRLARPVHRQRPGPALRAAPRRRPRSADRRGHDAPAADRARSARASAMRSKCCGRHKISELPVVDADGPAGRAARHHRPDRPDAAQTNPRRNAARDRVA